MDINIAWSMVWMISGMIDQLTDGSGTAAQYE